MEYCIPAPKLRMVGIPLWHAHHLCIAPVAGTCAVYQSWVNFHAANAANTAFPGYAVVKPFTKVCGGGVSWPRSRPSPGTTSSCGSP